MFPPPPPPQVEGVMEGGDSENFCQRAHVGLSGILQSRRDHTLVYAVPGTVSILKNACLFPHFVFAVENNASVEA